MFAVSLPSAATALAKSKRPNGWELLYTEKSAAAMAGTKHHRNVMKDPIPVDEIPHLRTGAYKIEGEFAVGTGFLKVP